MRCKKHPTDLSSTSGVCASCLRERLLRLMEEQARADDALAMATHSGSSDDRRRHETQPPQPAFPRSVSPYVARRKSYNRHCHFYSTPQIGPIFSATCSFPSSKKKQSKLSFFANLFRSRSDKINSDPSVCSNSDPRISPPRDSFQAPSSSYSSPSWLSFLPRRRHKQPPAGDASVHTCRRPCRISNRGMSPDRGVESYDRFNSGYSSESSQQEWRRTPVVAVTPAAVRRKRAGHTKSASGLAFCLSPLVRASPSRQWNWNHKGGLQPEIGFSGEVRVSGKPYRSTAVSFSGNRPRKFSDYGRFSYNR